MKLPTPSFATWILLAFCLVCGGTILWIIRPNTPQHAVESTNRTLAEYYTTAQQLAQKSAIPQTSTVTFLAVGDISLSRAIAARIKKQNNPSYPFARIQDLLRSTDFNFGNLETPFSSSDAFTSSNTLIFNAPKQNVAGLVDANFKVLTLANNHALDQGMNGIRTTRTVLGAHNILYTGTGENLDEAWTPAVYEANGITVGFIGASYASINDGGKYTNNNVARMEDTSRLKSQVSALKSRADFIVVTMHAGVEYTVKPTQAQIDFAHAAIDAGADIVIGHHAHWVQEKELYCPGQVPTRQVPRAEGEIIPGPLEDLHITDSRIGNCKWIYYGLGNFIFDQSWSEQTKKGLALKISLTKTLPPKGTMGTSTSDLQPAGPQLGTRLQSIQEIPIYIEENCCPTPSATLAP